jgi:hypothetical protein
VKKEKDVGGNAVKRTMTYLTSDAANAGDVRELSAVRSAVGGASTALLEVGLRERRRKKQVSFHGRRRRPDKSERRRTVVSTHSKPRAPVTAQAEWEAGQRDFLT